MSEVEIKRESRPLPPIEKIKFTTEFGVNCTIRKDKEDFICYFGHTDYVFSKKKMKEIYECLGKMLEGK